MMNTIHIIEELGIPTKLQAILRDFKSVEDSVGDHKSRNSNYRNSEQDAGAEGVSYGHVSHQHHQDSAARSFQVKDRAECALIQIMRAKDLLHC
jgi:hypothetical protein